MDYEPPPVLPFPSEDNPLLTEVVTKFQSVYGCAPEFAVQVPGRVNLIGEHVDYCGYSVLPVALQQYIVIAVRPNDSEVLKIENVSDKYEAYEGNVNNLSMELNNDVLWYNYVICGIRGVSECTKMGFQPCGMSMTVLGNILPNAGLSSSSALVCAAALGTAYANKVKVSRQELATICAKCEKYIGTEGGGMDQAIAFLANAGCAKYISFKPLHTSDVRLPMDAAIVVAHSLAEINKAANSLFNCRVAECRLAALILAHESGLKNWRQFSILADIQAHLHLNLRTMSEKVEQILKKNVYPKEEICCILQVSQVDLEREFLPENTWHIESFKLRQRALHVYQEAARVEEFKQVCDAGGDISSLGRLMNSSHDSLRDLYECSHEQLDALVTAAREGGALGARLTGAGWGGCIVALSTKDKVSLLMKNLKERFYSLQDVKDTDLLIFSAAPGSGAVVFQL